MQAIAMHALTHRNSRLRNWSEPTPIDSRLNGSICRSTLDLTGRYKAFIEDSTAGVTGLDCNLCRQSTDRLLVFRIKLGMRCDSRRLFRFQLWLRRGRANHRRDIQSNSNAFCTRPAGKAHPLLGTSQFGDAVAALPLNQVDQAPFGAFNRPAACQH